jgi:hypothetical protein
MNLAGRVLEYELLSFGYKEGLFPDEMHAVCRDDTTVSRGSFVLDESMKSFQFIPPLYSVFIKQ